MSDNIHILHIWHRVLFWKVLYTLQFYIPLVVPAYFIIADFTLQNNCRIVALIFDKLISKLSDMKSDIYPYSVPLSERKCIFSEKQKIRKYAV